jgi:DNA (cytosine-5)-methyltransferase 1
VGFCDIEPYAQQLLKIRFPGVKIYDNIKTLDGTKIKADIITGGFPCQPFSMAGKRRGTEDDRHLWPEMARVIAETRPRWVIGENVRGLVNIGDGVFLETVITDLESLGYEVQPFVIPACAVGAPHRRDRIWIVANTRHGNGTWNADSKEYETEDRQKTTAKPKRPVECDKSGIVANAEGRGDRRHKRQEFKEGEPVRSGGQNDKHALKKRQRQIRQSGGNERYERREWGKNWLEVATRLCGVDDGLPAELDGFKLSKAGHRVARLKGLGNAIVPQVVLEIMRTIKEADDAR